MVAVAVAESGVPESVSTAVSVPPVVPIGLLSAIPAVIAEALDEQVKERLKGGLESQVDLATHRLFDVKPTTCREFAERSAAAFTGAAAA